MAKSRPLRKLRRKLVRLIFPALAPPFLHALARSWKVEQLDLENWEEAFREPGRLLALWHGRMMLGMVHHRDPDFVVLVSPSKDGDLADIMLKRLDYRTIRGSSNKDNARALRAMMGELREGGTIAITPDGPRGPRHGMNPGLAWMAAKTGFPVVPCGFVCDRAWRLESWDRFTIPKRRARLVLAYGEPVRVDKHADEAAQKEATALIRARILAAEQKAFAHLDIAPDW